MSRSTDGPLLNSTYDITAHFPIAEYIFFREFVLGPCLEWAAYRNHHSFATEMIQEPQITESARRTTSRREPIALIADLTSVNRNKVVIAVTGAWLILFVIATWSGNLKIFSGPEKSPYCEFLVK